MKILKTLSIVGLSILSSSVFSQKIIELTNNTLNLQIIQKSGNNGNGVVYNSDKDLYYAAYAGNKAYPLETFSATGTNLHQSSPGVDIRGLWYNPNTQNLEANCYKEIGYYTIKTDSRGYGGTGTDLIYSGKNQPDDNSCGNIDKKGRTILYYSKGAILSYDRETGKSVGERVDLEIPTSIENINTTTFIYTGEKKMEIGLLNYNHKEVYLFSQKNGAHTATIKLPSSAITSSRFRFSFANGYLFLYDSDTRSWTGYQLFE